ncbi:MAG: hypothetical protein ABFC34_08550 [Methanobacterium sp.]
MNGSRVVKERINTLNEVKTPSKTEVLLETFKNNSYEISENDFLISSIDRIIVGLKYIHSYIQNDEIGDCIHEMKLIRDTLEDKKPELIKHSFEIEQELNREIEAGV